MAIVIGKWRQWQWIDARWFRWLIVLVGPLSLVAIEAGWWLAEFGLRYDRYEPRFMRF